MIWPELLSTLWTQTSSFSIHDFRELAGLELQDPTRLAAHVRNEKLRSFLLSHSEWWKTGEVLINWIRKNSAAVTYPGQSEYPEALLDLEAPPVFLSYYGSAFWKTHPLLSVVGSRSPSPHSLQWMETELVPLVERGVGLVSGGALGIDQRAHRICVRHERPTMAFLPSGLAQFYPQSFQAWLDLILESGGAVLSELSPFESMRKYYFIKRNRMIAAMSPTTLIVEARRQSGTIMTARLATENGRSLGVVPGLAGEPRWAGSLDLLSSGGILIRDHLDLMALMSSSDPSCPIFSKKPDAKGQEKGIC